MGQNIYENIKYMTFDSCFIRKNPAGIGEKMI